MYKINNETRTRYLQWKNTVPENSPSTNWSKVTPGRVEDPLLILRSVARKIQRYFRAAATPARNVLLGWDGDKDG